MSKVPFQRNGIEIETIPCLLKCCAKEKEFLTICKKKQFIWPQYFKNKNQGPKRALL